MGKSAGQKDPLVRELTRVSGRRFDKMDEHRGSYKPLTAIEELTQLAETFTETHDELKRWERIKLLIEAAVERVDDRPMRKRIEHLYGLLPGRDFYTARALHREVREVLDRNSDEKTTYLKNQQALNYLAQAIRKVVVDYRRKRRNAKRRYVRRERYHREFQEAFESGARVIEIVGLPGIGKSWFASAVVSENVAEGLNTIRVRFNRDVIHIPDLHAALNACGFQASLSDIDRCPEVHLAELLSGVHAPEFAILDGLSSAEQAYDLLPDLIKPTVVITARRASDRPTPDRAVINIREMEKSEAVNVIQNMLPSSSRHEQEVLAGTLNGYPLLISRSCALLQSRAWQFSSFVASIGHHFASLTDRAKTDEGEYLTLVLQGIVEQIKVESQLAYEMLPCLGFVEAMSPIRLCEMRLYLEFGREDEYNEVEYMQALDVLDQFSIIELSVDELKEITEIVIHPAIQDAMRRLLPSAEERVAAQMRRVLDRLLAPIRKLEAEAKITWKPFEKQIEELYVKRYSEAVTLSEIDELFLTLTGIHADPLQLYPMAIMGTESKRMTDYFAAHPDERSLLHKANDELDMLILKLDTYLQWRDRRAASAESG